MMMKSVLILHLFTRLLVILGTATPTHCVVAEESKRADDNPTRGHKNGGNIILTEEDAGFWTRFLTYHPPSGSTSTNTMMNAPTPRPVLRRSPLPTRIPVAQPTTPVPTRLPPQIDCSVTVELECQTTRGQSCRSAPVPATSVCDVGRPLDALTFTYQGRSCNALGNSQGLNSTCRDVAPIMFDDPVTVQCHDAASGDRLTIRPSPPVEPLDAVTVSPGPGGIRLPNAMYCTIQDAVDGTLLQNNTIATLGTVRLDLGNEFGALRLAGCDRGEEFGELSCFDVFSYHVVIRNDGTTDLSLTQLDFTLHDMDLDLLPVLQMRTETVLLPGTSAVIATSSRVNVCDTRVFMAAIDVGGDSPNGGSCAARAEIRYAFVQLLMQKTSYSTL
jgi:hypothetical protein